MMDILVLGCGLVGGPIALDLSGDEGISVLVADLDAASLGRVAGKKGIQTMQADLSVRPVLDGLLQKCDFVVNAVPGYLGYTVLQAIIASGKSGVDITFMPEKFWELDQEAQNNRVTIIPDMGVAPGLSNLLAAHAANILDKTEHLRIFVGGLPKVRTWPYQYKAVFSPADVLEEYTRPALMVENGRKVIKPALTESERIEIEGIGSLEAFNSDGLRSLAYSLDIPNMVEKTLRYPGHRELMEVLRESGFFSSDELSVKGTKVRPIDLTAALLFKQWKLQPGDEDITAMKIVAQGEKDGKRASVTFDLYDEYDQATGVHSMARTTGYSASMALRLIIAGLIDEKGIVLPEKLASRPECVEFIWNGLAERGIILKQTIDYSG